MCAHVCIHVGIAREHFVAQLVLRGLGSAKMYAKVQELIPRDIRAEVLPLTVKREDVVNDIRQAAVVLIPSRAEAHCLVALEAIAAEVPIVIMSRCGVAELLCDSVVQLLHRYPGVLYFGSSRSSTRTLAHFQGRGWCRAASPNGGAAHNKAQCTSTLPSKVRSWHGVGQQRGCGQGLTHEMDQSIHRPSPKCATSPGAAATVCGTKGWLAAPPRRY